MVEPDHLVDSVGLFQVILVTLYPSADTAFGVEPRQQCRIREKQATTRDLRNTNAARGLHNVGLTGFEPATP